MNTKTGQSVKKGGPSRLFASRYIVFDMVGMVLLIGGASWLFRPSDPAWLEINPSPWLMIPLLIGFRYGFWSGVKSAIIAAGCSALLTCMPNYVNVPALIAENAIHYTSYIGVAGVAGFARHIFIDSTPELEREVALLEGELKRKDSALSLYRENEIQLKQSLLLHNANFVSLSDELIKILQVQDDQEAVAGMLNLLQGNFGIISGGMYIESNAKEWKRIASIAKTENELPESLGRGEEMIDLAIREKQLVTCKDLWERNSTRSTSPYLAVIPVGEGRACLVIRRMKLDSITWDNFGRIEAILNYWIGGRAPGKPAVKGFDRALESAIRLRDDLGVPGYVVQFEGGGDLEDKVSKLVMPGYYSEIGAKLCVIVLEGRNGAKAFGERVANSIHGTRVTYDIFSLETVHSGKGK